MMNYDFTPDFADFYGKYITVDHDIILEET